MQALRKAANMAPVVKGACAADAVVIANDGRADVILIDVHNLPGGNAELLRTLVHDHPAQRIVVLSASERPSDAVTALEAGVSGYVVNSVEGFELVEIIKAIHAGRAYISPQLAVRAISFKYSHQTADERRFTRGEEQVFAHVSRGMTNKEVGSALHIGEKTVKNYMTSIMKKLHVRSRVQAVLAGSRDNSWREDNRGAQRSGRQTRRALTTT
jgi:DNA-binding NarL/FixJ family response regulator